jgi:hypothetical protein
MNYVLFAIGCYIIMRALPVVFDGQREKAWFKAVLRGWAAFTLYSALASLLVFYFENLKLLGFPAGN